MSDVIVSAPSNVVQYSPAVAERLKLDDAPGRLIGIGGAIAVAFFVVLLSWAAVVRLDAAAAGQGQVSVAGNRQTVQHRDGGIVQQLGVRDGQHVTRGQVLIRLEGAEVAANERALAGSVIDLEAQRARLEADVRGTEIAWPASFSTADGDDQRLVDRAKKLQLAQQSARRSSLSASRGVLSQQQAEVAEQTEGFRAQARANEAQRQSLERQLANTRTLAEQGYVSRNTVHALERSVEQLAGSSAEYTSRAAAARQQIGATQQQISQSTRRYIEDSAAQLRDTQFQLNEMRPKWLAAKEQLERTVIRAPVSGQVVGLRIFSVGGVIQAGQPLLDIVPDAAPLILKVEFEPDAIDGVYPGRLAEVKFLSMHERDLPIIMGQLRTVSADALVDDTTRRSVYTAEIVVPAGEVAKIHAVRGGNTGIRPGMPVQALVKLRKRTALQYLLDPLTDVFGRAFHER